MKALKNLMWYALAKLISQKHIAATIVRRAQKTPYSPILGRTNDRLYMDRWWIFNPYGRDAITGKTLPARWRWLPSIRVHHICLPDDDAHEHDHPWNARSIILQGWSVEERKTHQLETRVMRAGDTAPLFAGQFHRIARVSDGGVFTLFFTWQYVEDWGFWVEGSKQPWREYLAERAKETRA